MEEHKIEWIETITYDLTTRWKNNDSIMKTFKSMDHNTQTEAIRKYKAILITHLGFWIAPMDVDNQYQEEPLPEEQNKTDTIENISPETSRNITTLARTYYDWMLFERYTKNSNLEVATRWMTKKGSEIIISFEVFTSNWDTNIHWLKQLHTWYNTNQS